MTIPSIILTHPSPTFFPFRLKSLLLQTWGRNAKKSFEERRHFFSCVIWSDDARTARSPVSRHQQLCGVFCLPVFPQIIKLLVPLMMSFYMTTQTAKKISSCWPLNASTHATTILFSRVFHCSDTGLTWAISIGSKAFLYSLIIYISIYWSCAYDWNTRNVEKQVA